MADWDAIKTEYITTATSYRELAAKYGVNKDTIWRRGKSENWEDLRRPHSDKVQTGILLSDTEQKVSRADKLHGAADMLLRKVIALIEASDPMEMDIKAMKHISGVLKDIKEIQSIKSDADRREQEARIAHLISQADKENKEKQSVTITLEGGLTDYAQ